MCHATRMFNFWPQSLQNPYFALHELFSSSIRHCFLFAFDPKRSGQLSQQRAGCWNQPIPPYQSGLKPYPTQLYRHDMGNRRKLQKNVKFSSGGCVIVAFVKSLFFAQIFGTKIRSDPNTDEPSPRPYLLQSGGKLRRQWGRSLRV